MIQPPSSYPIRKPLDTIPPVRNSHGDPNGLCTDPTNEESLESFGHKKGGCFVWQKAAVWEQLRFNLEVYKLMG